LINDSIHWKKTKKTTQNWVVLADLSALGFVLRVCQPTGVWIISPKINVLQGENNSKNLVCLFMQKNHAYFHIHAFS